MLFDGFDQNRGNPSCVLRGGYLKSEASIVPRPEKDALAPCLAELFRL